jgi:hypothetical protein
MADTPQPWDVSVAAADVAQDPFDPAPPSNQAMGWA